MPFKPGATSAKVTFTNEDSGEYLFYELQLNAGEAADIPDIKLEAIVRQKFVHSIPIENPFNTEVSLSAQLGRLLTLKVSLLLPRRKSYYRSHCVHSLLA